METGDEYTNTKQYKEGTGNAQDMYEIAVCVDLRLAFLEMGYTER